MIKRLQNAEGEEVKSHEELRNGRDIFKADDVYLIEISTHFPAASQRLAEANIRPCRQPHQQQKQRPHDDGSQMPDLGDSRGYALRGLRGPPVRVGASPSQLHCVWGRVLHNCNK